MSFLSFLITMTASGLLAVQQAGADWLKARGASLFTEGGVYRFADARVIAERMPEFIETLKRSPKMLATFDRFDLDIEACIPYVGALTDEGYAPFKARKDAFEFFTGMTIPEGYQLDHLCHDDAVCKKTTDCPHRACANAAHLMLATASENGLRSPSQRYRSSESETCMKGHLFTLENTYITMRKSGTMSRRCVTCYDAHVEAVKVGAIIPRKHATDGGCWNGHGPEHRKTRSTTGAVYCSECNRIAAKKRADSRKKHSGKKSTVHRKTKTRASV
jgi:hypothetical protein